MNQFDHTPRQNIYFEYNFFKQKLKCFYTYISLFITIGNIIKTYLPVFP